MSVLTLEILKETWKEEFLPAIRKEIRTELKKEIALLNETIKTITARCDEIEKSQEFQSKQYEEILKKHTDTTSLLQEAKKEIKRLQDVTTSQEQQISQLTDQQYNHAQEIDEILQYSRRDCIEIVGIPKAQDEDPKEILKEVCSIIGVNIKDEEISTIHRLPDSKKQKDRLIAKFVRRETKDKVYQSRRKLVGKTTNHLPSFQSHSSRPSKIFINESLTKARKALFSKIYEFKKDNNYKFLWTNNGKIYLREKEQSPLYSFVNIDDFQYFMDS